MVKDGFLFYYGDRERKEFDRRQFFNIHPKVSIHLLEKAVSCSTCTGLELFFKIKVVLRATSMAKLGCPG